MPSALIADPALARCPPSRRCGSKCCPAGMKCKHGKCRCTAGLTKCGKKCFDLSSDPANCGTCGYPCPPGYTCAAGRCTGGGGDGGTTQSPVCGNGVKEAGEICDGADLAGATCQSLGFLSGTLACTANCTYDTSGCVSPSCSTAADCPQGPVGDCQKAVCTGGTCGFVADNADLPADDGNPCTGEACNGGVPSHPPKVAGASCPTGTCNGSGACVAQCAQASDCPGTDTPCQSRTCNSGVCGTYNYPYGTDAGCKVGTTQRVYCDGYGGIYTAGTCSAGDVCCSYQSHPTIGGVEVGACC